MRASLLLWLLAAISPAPSRGQEGLTYSPKMLFVDNYQSLFFSIAEENCARGFQSMYQNLAVLDVWSSIKEDNPCKLCQDQNKNSHCCQTYDAASGVCACSTSRTGLGRMLRMCALMKGRFAHIHGSFTGMYGEGYVYRRRNLTVTCVPNPSVHCPAEGVESFLRALAGHCVVFNQRLQKDARCEFSMGGGFMLQGKDGVLRKLVGAAGNAAAAGAAPNSAVAALTWAMAVVLAQRTL